MVVPYALVPSFAPHQLPRRILTRGVRHLFKSRPMEEAENPI